MISNSYIHEQMAVAHHRDLLEAAEHARHHHLQDRLRRLPR